MVFPSIPIYLDPPNWSQQQPNQQAGIDTQNLQIPPPSQPSPSTITVVEDGGYPSSIKSGSMVDRARLAKMHQPDASLKCPRCESTNTKFCYYNNYNLSQPRHFCKTCRRYWTRGGTLRNVPVGGGFRRNKRSKGSSSTRSKSSMKAAAGSSSASANSNSSSGCTNSTIDVMTHLPNDPSPPTHLPFLPTNLHHSYSDYIYGGNGLNFGTFPTSMVARNGNNSSDAEFQIGTTSSGGINNGDSLLPNLPQVHQQQFPFLTNLEPQIGLFKLDGENSEVPPSYVRDGGIRFCSKALDSSTVSGMIPQLNTIKMEENQGLSLSKNVLGSSGNDIFWSGSGNAWCEVPSFTSPRS